MDNNLAYLNYWQRKNLLISGVPKFEILNWWKSENHLFSESEQIIFDNISQYSSILDIGAGDLSVMKKIKANGYQGEYHTQDIGQEYEYTYSSLNKVERHYDAVLCLDVIEHLSLPNGLEMIHAMIKLLNPGGILVIQTPNARCIRNPLSTDMTHLHCYNIVDLWTYLTALDFDVKGYRVVFGKQRQSWKEKFFSLISKYIITRIIGMDYADNILIFAQKSTPVLV